MHVMQPSRYGLGLVSRREVQVLGTARHENVVDLLGIAQDRHGDLFMVMEYCEQVRSTLVAGRTIVES